MSFITVIAILIGAGLLMYLVNNYIPLKSWMKTFLNMVVILVLVFWLLKLFGLIGNI